MDGRIKNPKPIDKSPEEGGYIFLKIYGAIHVGSMDEKFVGAPLSLSPLFIKININIRNNI